MKNEQKYKTPSKHETIADILAYMRECADGTEKHGLYDLRDYGTDYLRAISDNIEAAEKREVAKLRAKLKVAEDALRKLQERLVSSVYDGTIDPHEALKIAEDAIAAISEEGSEK